ncbi:ABC transporter permease [Alteromonas halophila]|uniref:Peptide ABC transporter permease n=1 Tax=Alteromonas halophila TaxID=516698 RepID=A0A918MW24_9ALTE|nr:ABC transporter permease [Alteromonas halophila]GGW78219.1 peptide ABC transporter permease [Alteromonas halophila]
MILSLATASLKNRRGSVLLTVFSIVISVSLLLSVEYIRGQVKESFTRTVSGVDLIVGGRTGQLNLLLYSVFRIGNPTTGIAWQSVEHLQNNPSVAWMIPIALGDAHKGFRVVGTDNRYFDHFKYGSKQSLTFAHGGAFSHDKSAVIGADVARELGYSIGDDIVVAHGLGDVSFKKHDSHPFTISGILAATGTPVDQAVYVTLQGLESVHEESGQQALRKPISRKHSIQHDSDHAEHDDHHTDTDTHTLSDVPPDKISAVMLGLNNRVAALQLQHQVNQYKQEPLMAILPGVALAQLWELMGNVEKLLLGISALILLSSLVGLTTMLLASMRERRQEIAVLRAIGAGPGTVLWLIQAEALLISSAGCVIAFIAVSATLYLSADWLSSTYGLFVSGTLFTPATAIVVVSVILATWLVSFIPALAAYRRALHSGLQHP